MRNLAFVLAAAGIMTLPACQQQPAKQVDLSPVDATPAIIDTSGVLSQPVQAGSPSTSPDSDPDTDYLTVQRSISSAMPDEEDEMPSSSASSSSSVDEEE